MGWCQTNKGDTVYVEDDISSSSDDVVVPAASANSPESELDTSILLGSRWCSYLSAYVLYFGMSDAVHGMLRHISGSSRCAFRCFWLYVVYFKSVPDVLLIVLCLCLVPARSLDEVVSRGALTDSPVRIQSAGS